jgi:prevent-host-death family protein
VITKHGVERAVVLSVDDYRRLVQIERSRDLGREIDL